MMKAQTQRAMDMMTRLWSKVEELELTWTEAGQTKDRISNITMPLYTELMAVDEAITTGRIEHAEKLLGTVQRNVCRIKGR